MGSQIFSENYDRQSSYFEVYFSKVHFPQFMFPKCIFPNVHFSKNVFFQSVYFNVYFYKVYKLFFPSEGQCERMMQHCGEIRPVARIDPHEACWAAEQQGLSNQLGDGLPMDKDDDNKE